MTNTENTLPKLDPTKLELEPTKLEAQLISWRSGIQAEISFWDKWIATKGFLWPESYKQRLEQKRELSPELLRDNSLEEVRVLDAGAGPLTFLGNTRSGKAVELHACDPLSPIYKALLRKHGVTQLTTTEQAFFEDLSAVYPLNYFDLVFCNNALDHSFDPLRGIEQMLSITKANGRVHLSHAVNEAENENYVGFHQWNFDESDGSFIIWNKTNRYNVSHIFADLAEVTTNKQGKGVVVKMDKRRQSLEDHQAARARLKEMYSALLYLCMQP